MKLHKNNIKMTKTYLEHKIFEQKENIGWSADNSKGYRCVNIKLTTHKYGPLAKTRLCAEQILFIKEDQGEPP